MHPPSSALCQGLGQLQCAVQSPTARMYNRDVINVAGALMESRDGLPMSRSTSGRAIARVFTERPFRPLVAS
jgi:hypothetical protein